MEALPLEYLISRFHGPCSVVPGKQVTIAFYIPYLTRLPPLGPKMVVSQNHYHLGIAVYRFYESFPLPSQCQPRMTNKLHMLGTSASHGPATIFQRPNVTFSGCWQLMIPARYSGIFWRYDDIFPRCHSTAE
jgi:hypothetical protein